MAWLLAALAGVRLGAVAIAWPDLLEVLGPGSLDPALTGTRAIVWEVRLPRVLMGGLAGAGLAVAGCAWQGVLRNPLADPYLIGASAGAALGAGAAILFGVGGGTSFALPLLAFAGALGAVSVTYRLASTGASLSVERLLLAGVAVSAFLSAVLSLAMLARAEAFTRLYFWLMGGLAGRGWEHVGMLAPYVVVTGVAIALYAPRLNALQLGEETAQSLGVDLVRDRRAIIVLASLLTAAVVSTCGMIGFVGLVVPHLVRMIAGPDMRRLLPLAACGGAALLTGADLAARTLWAPVEIPVGVLTAMAGAPFFLMLLARRST